MNPLLLILGGALGFYLLTRKPGGGTSGFVPVPIPPPNPDGTPPRDVQVAPMTSLVADLSSLKPGDPHGTPVQVAWEFMSGHPSAGGRGSAPLPLLWVSPDRKFAAVLWTLDPALKIPLGKPGDVFFTLVKS